MEYSNGKFNKFELFDFYLNTKLSLNQITHRKIVQIIFSKYIKHKVSFILNNLSN